MPGDRRSVETAYHHGTLVLARNLAVKGMHGLIVADMELSLTGYTPDRRLSNRLNRQ